MKEYAVSRILDDGLVNLTLTLFRSASMPVWQAATILECSEGTSASGFRMVATPTSLMPPFTRTKSTESGEFAKLSHCSIMGGRDSGTYPGAVLPTTVAAPITAPE